MEIAHRGNPRISNCMLVDLNHSHLRNDLPIPERPNLGFWHPCAVRDVGEVPDRLSEYLARREERNPGNKAVLATRAAKAAGQMPRCDRVLEVADQDVRVEY